VHAPYCTVVCGLFVSAIFFPHHLINGKIFEKKVIEYKMCVFIFSANFVQKDDSPIQILYKKTTVLSKFCTKRRQSYPNFVQKDDSLIQILYKKTTVLSKFCKKKRQSYPNFVQKDDSLIQILYKKTTVLFLYAQLPFGRIHDSPISICSASLRPYSHCSLREKFLRLLPGLDSPAMTLYFHIYRGGQK
jgi:hypothetical protein